ncbi:MAG: BNR repeat-containing protein [Rubripirellula sp.]
MMRLAKYIPLTVFACMTWFMLASPVLAADLECIGNTTVDTRALTFAEGPAARFGLTVNGRSHQQQALTTHRGYQYAAYVDADRQICLGRRQLPGDHWEIIRFTDHRFKTNDSHNTAVVGICENDGTIHLAFDHHATPLNYRVSKIGVANEPERFDWDASLFGPISRSLGSIPASDRVTYPRFFSSPDGNLMLYYRSVTSGNGDGFIERYDGKQHDWLPGYGKFIARDIGIHRHGDQTSDLRCPYMDPLTFAGNRLHATWVWRDRFERTNPQNQHDLCYAYSDDFGQTWQNTAGDTIGQTNTNPVHLGTTGLVAYPISQDKQISNQNTLHVQEDGSVHVVLKAIDDEVSERRYHHYWRDVAGRWNVEVLPFSGNRPKLVGTKDGVLFLVFSDDLDDEDEDDPYLVILAKGIPNASHTGWDWQRLPATGQTTCGDPLVDVTRWKNEGVLSMYFQAAPSEIVRTEENVALDGLPSPLHVLDYRLK